MKRLFLLLTIITGLVLSGVVSACGGFFCQNTPIDQSAERIIFTVNGDGTITAIVGINYVGEAEDFSWIIPVPDVPEIDVAEYDTFNLLQAVTEPSLIPPTEPCTSLVPLPCCFGGGGAPLALIYGETGPYEYVVIGGESSDEIVRWLRDNDYRVTDEMLPAIEHYVEEDMMFLAMRLKRDELASSVQPVKLTYRADVPQIPLILTGIAATENMPVYVWIFADQRHIPIGFVNARRDFELFKIPGALTSPLGQLLGGGYGDAYQAELDRIQDLYDGRAFITEYAMPTTVLKSSIEAAPWFLDQYQEDDLLPELLENYPYVTRLYAQLSPEQMTVDPFFTPDYNNRSAPDGLNVSNVINLGEYVDPLHFNECSSRAALPPNLYYPEGRTYIDNLRVEVAHPPDWIHSTFSFEGRDFGAFAPVEVNARIFEAYATGDIAQPVMIYTEVRDYPFMEFNTSTFLLASYMGLITEENATSRDLLDTLNLSASTRYMMTGRYGDWEGARGFLYGWLSTIEQQNGNADLYAAMNTYIRSYQHYASRDFVHTLFLTTQTFKRFDVMIPFHEGWIEHTVDDDVYVIRPVGRETDETAPALRVMMSERFSSEWDTLGFTGISAWAAAEFDLSEDALTTAYDNASIYCDLWQKHDPIAYNHDGRTGHLYIMYDFIVDVYTTSDIDAARYGDTLYDMLTSIEFADC